MDHISLESEYKSLQEQQRRRLQRLTELKNQKQSTEQNDQMTSDAFGVPDQLEFMKLSASETDLEPVARRSTILADPDQQLKDQLRSLKDENGRLYKLLSEKDYEIRTMQNAVRRDSDTITSSSLVACNLSPDAATTKIMELSKKVRELTAEVESERNKTMQLRKKTTDLENEMKRRGATGGGKVVPPTQDENEMRQLRQSLKEADRKMTEMKCQNQALSADLKKAMKALGDEIGDPNVNLHNILNSTSNWRGRQQQIVALKDKIRNLEKQVNLNKKEDSRMFSADSQSLLSAASGLGRDTFRLDDSEFLSSLANGTDVTPAERNLLHMHRQRREFLEKCEADLRLTQSENEKLQKKLTASSARVTSLQNEIKSLKEQTKQLLEKGHHDDELISALLRQQKVLKETVEDTLKMKAIVQTTSKEEIEKVTQKNERESRVVSRLKEIIQQKEQEIVSLQNQLLLGDAGANEQIQATSARQAQLDEIFKVVEERFSQTSRPPTARESVAQGGSNESPALNVLRVQLNACEVERDKLRELTALQSARCETMQSQCMAAEKEMLAMRKYLVACERILAKHKLSPPQSISMPVSGPTTDATEERFSKLLEEMENLQEAPSKDAFQQLQQALSECLDEIHTLKHGLRSVLVSKKEDLKMLTEIMNETREQYLLAVKSTGL